MNAADKAFIEDVIKSTVNGKIDRLTDKVDQHNAKHEEDMRDVREHIEQTRPIIEAYQGGKAIGNLVKWVAAVGAAFVVIQGWLAGRL